VDLAIQAAATALPAWRNTPPGDRKVFQLIEQIDLPPGVLNMVHGAKESVNALLDHPTVRAISFVGSTPVVIFMREAEKIP
jgi:acyl-CoA reductase-like NAD-dependent aldehyde dehydrogenase